MPNPKDTHQIGFYADPEKSKLHPGCECCIHSEKRLQRALEAEAREYELLQKLKAIKEQIPSEYEKIFKDIFWEILA